MLPGFYEVAETRAVERVFVAGDPTDARGAVLLRLR